MSTLQIVGIGKLPEVRAGDDLAALIQQALKAEGITLHAGDVAVITSKVISKAEGQLVILESVTPSAFATAWALEHGKDPRHVEVVLREARRVVRMDRGLLIAETRHGFICANAGVDASNAGAEGQLVLLPVDPDGSAQGLRTALAKGAGIDEGELAVVVSDTFGRAWRGGQTNIAIGASGIQALRRYRGYVDPEGKTLRATSIAVVDELAGAAELVMHKLDRVPVAIVRGYDFPRIEPGEPDEGAAGMVRAAERDLFR